MPKLEQSEKYKDIGRPVITTRASVLEGDYDWASKSKREFITGAWTLESAIIGDQDTSNYLSYNSTDGFEIVYGDGGVRIDDSGIRMLDTTTSNWYISWKETDLDTGDTIAYMTSTWDGGAADDILLFLSAYKATGMSAGDAAVVLYAQDVDASATGNVTVCSTGEVSIGVGYSPIGNNNMTVGLTINQDTADDEILNFRSADVAHGGYGTDVDTFGAFLKAEAAAGGLNIKGYKDSDGTAAMALLLDGFLDENVDTTHDGTGRSIIEIRGFETSGGAIANTTADGNVVGFRTRRGGSVVTVVMIDEDGDIHLDGTVQTPYDDEDDALAVRSLAQGLAQRWNDGLVYNFDKLRELGVISGGDREHPFVSTKNLNALMMGAIGQLYERLERAGI